MIQYSSSCIGEYIDEFDSCQSADNAKLSSVEELERRQEKIFSQIEKLQHQVQDLMKDQNITLAQLAATAVSRARPNTGRSKVPPAPANVVLHPSKLLESCSKTRTAASATRKAGYCKCLMCDLELLAFKTIDSCFF